MTVKSKITSVQISLLEKVVAQQVILFPGRGKNLDALEDAGFVYITPSNKLAVFGDRSIEVKSTLDGEDFLENMDG
jgi:hypothetical protein